MKIFLAFLAGGGVALLNFIAGYEVRRRREKRQPETIGRWTHWG